MMERKGPILRYGISQDYAACGNAEAAAREGGDEAGGEEGRGAATAFT